MRIDLIIALALVTTAASLGLAEELRPTFEKDIRPIFRAHCFDCHGASEELKGGLDLRLVRLMKRGGDSGKAIDEEKPEASILLQRLRSGEMPPGETSVSPEEISIIEHWIASGASTARPEPESIDPGVGVTQEDRNYWFFQPIRRPEIQSLDSFPPEDRIKTPIDVLALAGSDSGFAPDADRRTLVIRAFFDLTGLPPAPEESRKWISDESDDWYDRLLTELLESPHYGERWARHWLDAAGYADSEGYTVADSERPWAWKYRDWVIRSLNDDKPFDQFITEQLAGDELAGPRQGDLTPQQIELLTATGFLRMAADGTGSGANNADGQNQVMSDTLKIVGTSLLGLSLQCAQCHDHRYDPIPQTDYYSLRAVFEPALNWKAWKVPNARRISLYTAADRKKANELESEAKKISTERAAKQAEFIQQALDKELQKYEEPLRAKLKSAFETPAAKRSEEQKALLAKNPSININGGNLYQYIPESKTKLAEIDKRIKDVRAQKPVEEFLRALVEPPNHTPETKLFHRGDHQQPKQTIVPAALTVASPEGQRVKFSINDESVPSTGRRLAFAKWLASPKNPLFARVIVNRIWMHHFGKGLVPSAGDFGNLGSQPTNPALLDWLAAEFLENGWSLKKLHRVIMQSTVWRQISTTALHRLEAETIRDRMLAVTGQLDPKLFGPPLKIKADDTGQVVVDGSQTRRSLYIQVRRSRPVAMLQTFDAPVMETNCECRSSSTVATQSLMMLNGQFTLDQAAKLADRISSEAEAVPEELLTELAELPKPRTQQWQYGYGSFDNEKSRTAEFTPLPHWDGSKWQGSEKMPDSKLGWAFLTATGGHTFNKGRAVIRRWTAPDGGTITVSGSLNHPSENGDGVRGRIVSSRSGKVGEWIAKNSSLSTAVADLAVQAGDSIDFLTDCRENYTSDSFSWTVSITLKVSGRPDVTVHSDKQFHGPAESVDSIPGQIIRAWQLAYCREPSRDELELAMGFIGNQLGTLEATGGAVPSGRTSIRQAMTNLCQALITSNEFLYVE